MKILRLEYASIEWQESEEAGTIRLELDDGQVLEVSEEQDNQGLHYLALRSPEGIIAVYPDSSNKIRFRIIQD